MHFVNSLKSTGWLVPFLQPETVLSHPYLNYGREIDDSLPRIAMFASFVLLRIIGRKGKEGSWLYEYVNGRSQHGMDEPLAISRLLICVMRGKRDIVDIANQVCETEQPR